jgi:hypothetical protein
VAYLNSHLDLDEKTRRLPGIELYKLFADGRHEGLTEIEQDSVSEFRDWMDEKHPKRQRGGHSWEILRGGNTTHILYSFGKAQREICRLASWRELPCLGVREGM